MCCKYTRSSEKVHALREESCRTYFCMLNVCRLHLSNKPHQHRIRIPELRETFFLVCCFISFWKLKPWLKCEPETVYIRLHCLDRLSQHVRVFRKSHQPIKIIRRLNYTVRHNSHRMCQYSFSGLLVKILFALEDKCLLITYFASNWKNHCVFLVPVKISLSIRLIVVCTC